MKKKVKKTKKSRNGDILALCNPGEYWSPVSREQAIAEIERAGKPYSEKSPYYTEYNDIQAAVVVMEDRIRGKYLRTDKDKTKRNNLLDLPDC